MTRLRVAYRLLHVLDVQERVLAIRLMRSPFERDAVAAATAICALLSIDYATRCGTLLPSCCLQRPSTATNTCLRFVAALHDQAFQESCSSNSST